MAHGHHIEIAQEQFSVPSKAKTIAIVAAVVGLIFSGIGIATLPRTSGGEGHEGHTQTEMHHDKAKAGQDAQAGHHDMHASADNHEMDADKFGNRAGYEKQNKPWMTRIWSSLLISGYYLLIISLAAMFFVAVQYIANAGWSAAILRVPQAMATFIPVAFILVFAVILMAKNDLYHWVHYEHQHLAKGTEGFDKILAGKSWFLNTPLFLILPAVLVLLWILIGGKIRKLSRQEDTATKGDTTYFKKSIRWSAGFAVLYGFLFSVVAWFYIMSIDAHWYSTIFGVYNFAIGWVTSITIICLFVIYLKSVGYLKIVSDEHVHDLGKFMFAFSIFWAYIWVSQYLLIWYAHIPEEMAYFQIRFEEYKPYFITNLVLNFFTPFLLLMMRNAKRNRWSLSIVGSLMIIGKFIDIWLLVTPGIYGPGMHIGLLEVGVFLVLAGIFVYWVLTALTKRGLVPVNHPYIEESAHHDVGV